MYPRKQGFTLIELMITTAIIAVVAAIAVPKLVSARISANENAALATLRTLASAQAQVVAASAIDTDADGGGEFGYIGELVGVAPLRVFDAATFAGNVGPDPMTPSILPTPFGDVGVDASGDGVVRRSGYVFKMYLPSILGGNVTGVPENGLPGTGGARPGALPDSDACEILWCCYAWPMEAGRTGNRAFFVNQEGVILQTVNSDATYDGMSDPARIPAFDAAFSNATGGGDMLAPLGISAMLAPLAASTNDGKVWTVAGN